MFRSNKSIVLSLSIYRRLRSHSANGHSSPCASEEKKFRSRHTRFLGIHSSIPFALCWTARKQESGPMEGAIWSFKHFNVFLLIILYLLISVRGLDRPQVVASQGSYRTSNVLGVNVSLYINTLDFDDDLYYAEGYYCPTSPSCQLLCHPGCDVSSPESCASQQAIHYLFSCSLVFLRIHLGFL